MRKVTNVLLKDTGLFDDNGKPIFVGDILESEWNYRVLVCESEDGYYGSLICAIGDSCRNIPYHLNEGKGHRIVAKAIERK